MATKQSVIYTNSETRVFRRLDSPGKVQDFLNRLKINFEAGGETCKSPRRTLATGSCHCMEGAMLAAAILEFHGRRPLVMDLRAKRPDDDHVVALFKLGRYWGGITKTNHAVLRYREPVYKSVRGLALSFFHEYFTDKGKKTLREYSVPVHLKAFDALEWRTSERDLFQIPKAIDKVRHFPILNAAQIRNLRDADEIEIRAGKLVEWGK